MSDRHEWYVWAATRNKLMTWCSKCKSHGLIAEPSKAELIACLTNNKGPMLRWYNSQRVVDVLAPGVECDA